MIKTLNVLIVDDHPIVIKSYKMALEHLEKHNGELSFKIKTANNCDTANMEIENALHGIPFDLVLLDIRLPPSACGELLSGEDIGQKLRTLFNQVKVMVFTSYNDNYRLNSILKNVNPDGFLIKEDTSFSDLVEAVETVIFDPPYYSKTLVKLFRRQIDNEFVLDTIDRQLLYQLSIGAKMKNLPKIIPLSIAGLERRKRKLKDMFNINTKEDKLLIKRAKESGFI